MKLSVTVVIAARRPARRAYVSVPPRATYDATSRFGPFRFTNTSDHVAYLVAADADRSAPRISEDTPELPLAPAAGEEKPK